jgi:hypothetical protein
VASVSAPEPRLLVVSPGTRGSWPRSPGPSRPPTSPQPQDDGQFLKIPFPLERGGAARPRETRPQAGRGRAGWRCETRADANDQLKKAQRTGNSPRTTPGVRWTWCRRCTTSSSLRSNCKEEGSRGHGGLRPRISTPPPAARRRAGSCRKPNVSRSRNTSGGDLAVGWCPPRCRHHGRKRAMGPPAPPSPRVRAPGGRHAVRETISAAATSGSKS